MDMSFPAPLPNDLNWLLFHRRFTPFATRLKVPCRQVAIHGCIGLWRFAIRCGVACERVDGSAGVAPNRQVPIGFCHAKLRRDGFWIGSDERPSVLSADAAVIRKTCVDAHFE